MGIVRDGCTVLSLAMVWKMCKNKGEGKERKKQWKVKGKEEALYCENKKTRETGRNSVIQETGGCERVIPSLFCFILF